MTFIRRLLSAMIGRGATVRPEGGYIVVGRSLSRAVPPPRSRPALSARALSDRVLSREVRISRPTPSEEDRAPGPCPPPRRIPSRGDLEVLLDLLRLGPAAVLTGAGCSTESGIPDYRGPRTGRREHEPIQYREFVEQPGARARYWARSAVGWTRIRDAAPNDAHRALARMESAGRVVGVITQNVDGLHQAAGSRRVLELHGSLAEVRCLECGEREARSSVQRRLLALNPGFRRRYGSPAGEATTGEGPVVAPDGDARVDDGAAENLAVPGCRSCGGVLKPDVVFFGENVPPERVQRAWALLDEARVLLVAGSSLSVYSGYRFVRRCRQEDRPVGIVNLTPTRGDGDARIRVAGRVGDVLPRLADALACGTG